MKRYLINLNKLYLRNPSSIEAVVSFKNKKKIALKQEKKTYN